MKYRSYYRTNEGHEYMMKNSKPYKWVTYISAAIVFLFFAGVGVFYLWSADTSHIARIASVEPVDTNPISLSAIEAGSYGTEDDCNIYSSLLEYTFKVTMDDGKEYYIDNDFFLGEPTDDGGRLYLKATVSSKQCRENFSKGINTADVNITVVLSKSGLLSDTEFDRYETTFIKELTECVVKEVKAVTDEELKYYTDAETFDLGAREFEITYSDGRRVVCPMERKMDENGYLEMYLDGYQADIYFNWEEKPELRFLDCVTVLEGGEYSLPIESIEITDCTFDLRYRPVSVSYTVTLTNKETITGTSAVAYYNDWDGQYTLSDTVLGYYIYIKPEVVYDGIFGDARIKVTATVAEMHSRAVEAEKEFSVPETDCRCICHSKKKLMREYNEFVRKLEKLLHMDEKCECGEVHYEK